MTEDGEGRKPAVGRGVKIFACLAAIGLIGAYTGLQVILAFRSLYTGSLTIMAARLLWLGLGVWGAWFCFRRLRPLREGAGPAASGLIFYSAVALFLAGFLGARLLYRSPATKMIDEMEEERQACRSHVSSVLFASDPTDSHEPGSGYIVLKATFTARTRLVLQGGGWLTHPGADPVFSAELPRTELEAGVPRELAFYLLVNPEHDNSRALVTDGPYFIPEITAYVHDPARTEHWATWAKEISCRAPVIKNYTTRPYKAAEMGRVKWRYEGDYPFLPPDPKKAGKRPAAAPAAGKQGDSDRLLREAERLLKEAEESLARSKSGGK